MKLYLKWDFKLFNIKNYNYGNKTSKKEAYIKTNENVINTANKLILNEKDQKQMDQLICCLHEKWKVVNISNINADGIDDSFVFEYICEIAIKYL